MDPIQMKAWHDRKVEMVAKVMCYIAGIQPVDDMDGSLNWWVFNQDAEKIVADIEKRFPAFSGSDDKK